MVGTKRKHDPENEPTTPNSDSNPAVSHIFQTLVSAAAAAAPNGLKPPLLKELYYLLVQLRKHPWSCMEVGIDLNEFVFQIVPIGIKLTSKDICRLSDILFKELCKSFKQLLSALRVVSASRADKQEISIPDLLVSAAELNLLLRCCMKVLDLLERQHICDENGRFLLVIVRTLRQLVSSGESGISLEHSYSSKIDYGDDGSTRFSTKEFVASMSSLELTDSCIPILTSIVMVFVDELSVSGKLRRYFSIIDSVSSTREILSMDYLGDCDLKVVMELICTHFFLFISKEQDFEIWFNRLSWHHKDFLAPEISLHAAVSLLHKPLVLSAPKLMQTHMISLVSEAIGFGLDFDHSIPDLKLILSTFRRAVILYADHIAKLRMDGYPEHSKFYFLKSNISEQSFQPVESYVQPVTREKISHLNTNFSNSWSSHYRDSFLGSKGDLLTSAIAYMKENLCILDRSCRDEMLSVVSCIITRASDDINSVVFDACDDASIQDFCFLASLIKLMSISLLQSLWCLRSRPIGCPASFENHCITSIINCFTAQDIKLPIESSLCNLLESQLTKHKKSKLMLFHFLRLLSFSFQIGIVFLVKGCILCIAAIMNLFVFEEGNLDALKSFVDIGFQYPQQAVEGRISSLVVATKFQKMQTLYLSRVSPTLYLKATEDSQPESPLSCNPGKMNDVATVDETEETCNGTNFLRCMGEKAPVLHDLADFIECKQGKDYRGWLKDREKFRKWKYKKRTALMWKKKKHAWALAKNKI